MYPGIILGNGATVKKKDYLKKIGAYRNIYSFQIKKNVCLECRGNSNVRFQENIPLDRQEGNKDIEDMSILRKICRSCKTAEVKSQILSLLPADNFAFINALTEL